MNDTVTDTVLQRKAQAQRKALGGGAWSVSRALGRALSIAADALWGLGLVPRITCDDIMPVDLAMSRLGPDHLIVVLENDSGARGLATFDRDIVTGFIDVQTLGRVTRFPADARAYTPTDAAMTAPVIDAALPRFASMLSTQPEMAHLQDYRFGALVEDAQTAGLVLDADMYHVIEFDTALAQDTRSGGVVFMFPEPKKAGETGGAPGPGKHEAVLKLAPVRMQAVLTRIHLSLDKAQALRPGDRLSLAAGAMTSAALVLSGGHEVARGKLGQMNGFRAIRIGTETTAMHSRDPQVSLSVHPVNETPAPTVSLPATLGAASLEMTGSLAIDGKDGVLDSSATPNLDAL